MKDLHFPKFKLSKNGKFLGWGTSPENDWKIIFITVFFVALMILAFCAYYFAQIQGGGVFTAAQEEAVPETSFNLNRLRQTLKHYEEKAIRFDEAKSLPEEILDPSL